MPHFQPQSPCDCLARTAQALNRFPDFPTRSSPDTLYIPADEVFILGAALVEHWELLHGCPVADTHLDARMLQTMIDAIVKTLTLYEAAVASLLEGSDKTQEPNSGGIDRSNKPSSTRDRSRDRSVETKPAVIVTEVTGYLGSMQLDSREMVVVARETLRHATMRLGEMLHDIEEDMSIMRDPANPSQRNEHVGLGEVRQLTSRLLQILGRINSNDSTANEE